MIRNKLAEIMHQKGVKVVKLAKDTGISRNTITNTSQNNSEMLRMETVNNICKVLDITPCDFFEYVPLELEFEFSHEENSLFIESIANVGGELDEYNLELDIIIDIETKEEKRSVIGKLYTSQNTILTANYINNSLITYSIKFDEKEDEEFLYNTVSSLSSGMKKLIYKKLVNEVTNYIKEEFKDDKTVVFFPSNYGLNPTVAKIISLAEIEINSDIFKKF
ncbi:helix-turn-helix domain-containing protein [Mammaliicoccus lentus]|uniref:helix-turn-helix domain-containing protein n=1 Tax=Mammaliicoccus lentus TaxID=42858 RepID=UPI0026494B6C|nr:helix-turn-helix transcriptional regulator [Mammaliicoccus lentus]